MAKIVLEHVDKIYEGASKVVDDLSLEIADGEFIVLVGPSGCGKSTTLRMIAGLEDVTRGTIKIGSRIVNDVAPKDRNIAMVFQSYALYPHMSAYDNMAFALKLQKTPKAVIDRRVREAAGILGIESLLDRKPRALSGGQRQRVAVGRAIVREPECFLFDEPLSNLDAKLRMDMRAEIKELQLRLHSTTVYVTHDQEEAMTLGDRVVVMKDGLVQQAGSAEEVYVYPSNRFVAGFLGNPPMNFITGSLRVNGEQLSFVSDGFELPVPDWATVSMRPHAGESVVLGIRPDALSVQDGARAGSARSFPLRVKLSQPLGDRTHVHFALPSEVRVVAQLDANARFQVGDTVPVCWDTDRVVFFAADAEGQTLAVRRRAVRDAA